MYYKLDENKKAIECSRQEWAEYLENNRVNKHVADEECLNHRISTIFLGLDHQFDDGPPLIFETMIFPNEIYCERYTTWDEAVAGHAKAKEWLIKLLEVESYLLRRGDWDFV